MCQRGMVALVGAGPGDPELLTVRAMRLLTSAEVVLHDNLISEEILALAPGSASRVNVGKRCGDVKDRGLQQREIHELLLEYSKRGQRVIRLKCGDPFIFGRGGEELEFLAQNGIDVEVVPGITTALGAAASCQMPLTHRDHGGTSVRFMVGQTRAKKVPDVDWGELAQSSMKQTVVFYMGMKMLDDICACLLSNKANPETPMALVENATLPNQRMVSGTISTLAADGRAHCMGDHGPVIVFLGHTAAFPKHLEKISGGKPRTCLKIPLGNGPSLSTVCYTWSCWLCAKNSLWQQVVKKIGRRLLLIAVVLAIGPGACRSPCVERGINRLRQFLVCMLPAQCATMRALIAGASPLPNAAKYRSFLQPVQTRG